MYSYMEYNLVTIKPFQKEFLYFLQIVKYKSFLKTAEEIGIQQSGLSKIIKKLEKELGTTLFVRSVKGVELTEYGEKVYQLLKLSEQQWNKNVNEIEKKEIDFEGDFNFGCHPSIASNYYQYFLPQISKHYPLLNFNTFFDSSENVTKQLVDLEIDAGLVINPIKNADLVCKPIKKESVYLWKTNQMDSSISKNQSESNSKTIVYNPEMIKLFQSLKKFENYKQIQIKDYDVIASLISHSDLVGILPEPVAKRYNLKQIGSDLFQAQLSVVYHKTKVKGSYKQKIIQFIIDKLVAS